MDEKRSAVRFVEQGALEIARANGSLCLGSSGIRGGRADCAGEAGGRLIVGQRSDRPVGGKSACGRVVSPLPCKRAGGAFSFRALGVSNRYIIWSSFDEVKGA